METIYQILAFNNVLITQAHMLRTQHKNAYFSVLLVHLLMTFLESACLIAHLDPPDTMVAILPDNVFLNAMKANLQMIP